MSGSENFLRDLLTEYNRLAKKLSGYLPGEAFAHEEMSAKEAKWRGLFNEEVLMARTKIQRDTINKEIMPNVTLENGMTVFDIGIPHVFGKIVKLGPEVSTVAWKNGVVKESHVGNIFLAPVEAKTWLIKISRRGNLKSAIPFAAIHVAARFVKECIGGEKYTWRTKNMIALSESGFELSCDGLEDLVEYKPKKKHEREWELPEPYRSWAKEISTGLKSGREMPEPILSSPTVERSRQNPDKPRTRRPPPDSGLVPLAKICDELGVEGRIARGILRKKMKKSDSGWNFKPEEVDAVKKLLKGAK